VCLDYSSTNNGINILRLSDLQGTGEFRSDNPEIRTIRIRYMYLDRAWFRNFVRICRSSDIPESDMAENTVHYHSVKAIHRAQNDGFSHQF